MRSPTILASVLVGTALQFGMCGCDPLCPPKTSDAGEDIIANVGDEIVLRGSGSRDLSFSESQRREFEALPLRFRWDQKAGPPVTLVDRTSPTTSFVPTAEGVYLFELEVDDLCVGIGDGPVFDTVVVDIEITGASSLNFSRPNAFAAGSHPQGITAGDLDGDSDLDLVVLNPLIGEVSVILNQGAGSFKRGAGYWAGPEPVGMALGDLDGDGDLDLAVTNLSADTVSILPNSGDGTLEAPISFEATEYARDVAIGDLDGDGDLDMLVVGMSADGISVLLNQGQASFSAPLKYRMFEGFSFSANLADFDGDGDLDIVAWTKSETGGSILLNNGNGTFEEARSLGGGIEPAISAIGDLDGDGDIDLATLDARRDDIAVLMNNGDGTFVDAIAFSVDQTPSCVTLGDMDGDGDLDLLACTLTGSASILLNDGDGMFGAPLALETGRRVGSLAVGDLDGDGDMDLAASNFADDRVSIMLNQTEDSLIPTWVTDLIAMLTEQPIANPPASVTQLVYHGQVVYYEIPRCCDVQGNLYDSDGTIICHPDGGFTGRGDDRCPDFLEDARHPMLIWEDQRTTEP